MYVIHKTSRSPSDASYSGSTWDRAGIRSRYRERYEDKAEAERDAAELTKHNAVGFMVTKVPEPLSAVETVYMYLLHDFREAHVAGSPKATEIDKVILYFDKRWPEDVARYRARFSKTEQR